MVTQQQIKRWNNSFNKLSEEDKRVAVAKDVIAQIKAKKYFASTGAYVNLETDLEENDSLQEHFDEISCSVCALGALFMSNVKFNNQCTRENLRVDKYRELNKYFSDEQLFLIEIAFECWEETEVLYIDEDGILDSTEIYQGIYASLYLDDLTDNIAALREKMEAAKLFGEKYDDENKRLTAIMKNIVKNKGIFIP